LWHLNKRGARTIYGLTQGKNAIACQFMKAQVSQSIKQNNVYIFGYENCDFMNQQAV
jgi:hypothetical protein